MYRCGPPRRITARQLVATIENLPMVVQPETSDTYFIQFVRYYRLLYLLAIQAMTA